VASIELSFKRWFSLTLAADALDPLNGLGQVRSSIVAIGFLKIFIKAIFTEFVLLLLQSPPVAQNATIYQAHYFSISSIFYIEITQN
jgi:hypothetical protein